MERLLIATRNKILFWDEGPFVIWEGDAALDSHAFYGVTWDAENVYIAERTGKRQGLIHVFDGKFSYNGRLSIGIDVEDVHQIFWWGGVLYITNTRRNQVLLWNGSNASAVSWKKPDEPLLHLNSIWCDGERFYVVEHRKNEMPKKIRMLDLNFVPIGCIELSEPFISVWPHGIHNAYVEDGILYTCSPNALVRHDLFSSRSRPIVLHRMMDDAFYARGLARVPGKFFIGLSEAKPRGERGEGDSAVLVTDDDFNVLDILSLENTGGLHEIRAIDGPDWAHNRVRCPLQKLRGGQRGYEGK